MLEQSHLLCSNRAVETDKDTSPAEQPEKPVWKDRLPDWQTMLCLLLLLILGILARVELFRGEEPQLVPDSGSYIMPAERLLNEGSIASRIRPPGYPLFLSMIYFICGESAHHAVVKAQHAIGIAVSLIWFGTFLLLIGNRWAALSCAAVIGLNYKVISFEGVILTEALCIFLVTAHACALVFYLQPEKGRSLKWIWPVVGTQAMLTLTKPFFMFLPLFVLPLLVFRWHRFAGETPTNPASVRKASGIYIAGWLLPILLWQSVNCYHFGKFQFSQVRRYNLLGKVMQIKQYEFAPDEYSTLARHIKNSSIPSPYHLEKDLSEKGVLPDTDTLEAMCKACILRAPFHFLISNLKLIPSVLGAKLYPSVGVPSKSRSRWMSRFIDWVNRYTSGPWKLSFVLVFVIILILAAAGPAKAGFPVLFWWQNAALGLVFIYSLLMATFAGYTDFGRLTILAAPVQQYFKFLFLPYLVWVYGKYKWERRMAGNS